MNLRSEAAIKEVIKRYHEMRVIVVADAPILHFKDSSGIVAELDLRDFVKKRKALTGINKRLRKALITPSKAKKMAKKKGGKKGGKGC